jgi:hypothetical protein
MSLLRYFFGRAMRRAAQSPEIRAKAGDFCREEVSPRLAAARDELHDLAKEADPRKNTGQFLRALGRRVASINRDDDR